MTILRRQAERGSVLLFSLTLIGVLSLSAAAVLVSQGSQSTLVGGIRERMVAGYIAEAGLAEASDKLLSIGIGPDGTSLVLKAAGVWFRVVVEGRVVRRPIGRVVEPPV